MRDSTNPDILKYVGKNLNEVQDEIKEKYNNVRIYKFDDAVTTDFDPMRLNVVYDNDGKIVGCYYG